MIDRIHSGELSPANASMFQVPRVLARSSRFSQRPNWGTRNQRNAHHHIPSQSVARQSCTGQEPNPDPQARTLRRSGVTRLDGWGENCPPMDHHTLGTRHPWATISDSDIRTITFSCIQGWPCYNQCVVRCGRRRISWRGLASGQSVTRRPGRQPEEES